MAKKSCCMSFQGFSSPANDVSDSAKKLCCMPFQGLSSPANDVSESAKKFCCMPFQCFSESRPDFENMFEKVEENDVVGLMNYISQLLERIRIGKTEAPVKNWSWPSNSSGLFNFLSADKKGVSNLKNISEAMTVVQRLLEKIGHASLVTAGLLVVAYGLERYQAVSANKEECLHILEEMSHLAKIVHEHKERPKLEVRMQDEIKAGTELIVKGAITCCTQIKSSGFSKFCLAAGNKEDLVQIKQDLQHMYRKMSAQMSIYIIDAIENKEKHSLSREYPENAVGIDEKIRQVMDLLEWESTENAVAVIVYGIGGMGKSTLADAVFSRVNFEGCRCSMVELFENIDFTPNIVDLQKKILKDLMGKQDIPEIRKHADGQRKLHGMLEKVEALIYIDNVLDEEKLNELLPLPEDMIKAKKVRLLITARDINVENAQSLCRIKRKKYGMSVMSFPAATTLLKQKMSDDMVRKLNPYQFNQIIHICSGIPLMLILAAKALCSKEDRQNVYVEVMEELEKLKGFENKLYKFLAYDSLPQECKDPFMDICSYLNGWDWDKVADIVGEEELKKLESRALVSKDTNEKATVHDVILRISGVINKSEGGEIRRKFTSARELIDFLDDEDEKDNIQRIKGIWMTRNSDSLDIPAQKLDLLHNSLRILALGKIRVMGECNEAFKKLVFLQADNVPNILWKQSKQLRYLSYKPAQDLNQQTKMPSNLKYLEIDGEFHNDDFGTFPETLLRQKDLRTLKLINFEGLKGLPSGLADLVKDLRELALSNCKSFEELPYSISNFQSLKVLRLDYCKFLKVLPNNFGKLSSLVVLDLSNCQKLTQLPKDFGLLKSLQVLSFKNCESLEGLPEGFENLLSLRILNLSFCKRLQNLPPHLGNLTSIVQLDLAHCSTLNGIPESIGDLKLLPSMDISWCLSLKELPDKVCNLSITSLKLNGCGRLEKLPNEFGKLQLLKVLKLKSCARLQKLPESFSQLKDLVHLDLSMCSRLEELCEDVHGLSSLRTLCLDGCNNLKKLPTGFHSLSSLQHLDLSNCKRLGAEWMDKVVQLNSLAMVYIRESTELVKRWGEIKGDHRRAFKVDIGQDLPQEEKENEWKNLSPAFVSLLTNRRGEPFHLSACPDPNTILLVMFDGHLHFNQDFPWPLIEETIDDIQVNFEIVYIGKHFSKLPKNVSEKIMGCALDDGDARLLFENLFFTLKRTGKNLWRQKMNKFFAMSTKIVEEVDGGKYISGWELLSNCEMEEFVLSKCGRYLSLKKVAAETQASNIHLLRELFVNEEQENCLLRNSHKVGVEELEGKTILLEIRLANDRRDQIRLQSLTKMYITGKENEEAGLHFEIISIPISQLCTKFEHFAGDVPWLVVQNPCAIGRAVKYFLIKQCQWEEGVSERSESWYPSRVLKIEPNGKIATYKPVLSMLERWGSEAYPFTEENIEKLKNKEWNESKSMSSLEFLFKPLKGELDEVKKIMHQGKMICLLCDGRDPDTKRVKTKTSVSSIERALKDVKDNMHLIYVPLYVEKNMLAVTDSIYMAYFPFDEPKMPEEKENLGLEPSLHLSQWAAMRFWARVNDLRKEIKGMDVENDEQWDGMKALLESLNFGSLSKTVMYEDGKMVLQDQLTASKETSVRNS